jgi:FkbM family methyltransferase
MESLFSKLEKRGDWYWPTTDHACWDFMHTYVGVVDKLCEYVPEKNVVVQAGGNVGFYIRRYAQLFKTVYTFEPEPLNFLALSLNCDYSNVIKFNACIGYERNLLSLNHSDANVGATHVQGSGIIPTIRIDDLNLQSCDLIQLDTEGYEYFGLLGAEETIDKFKPVISIEVAHYARYGVAYDTIINFLGRWNYQQVDRTIDDAIFVAK